jgi:hypothetical protein
MSVELSTSNTTQCRGTVVTKYSISKMHPWLPFSDYHRLAEKVVAARPQGGKNVERS